MRKFLLHIMERLCHRARVKHDAPHTMHLPIPGSTALSRTLLASFALLCVIPVVAQETTPPRIPINHKRFGTELSADGDYVVVSTASISITDDFEKVPGHVKVFNSTTGALLAQFSNPVIDMRIRGKTAISGTRLVVGSSETSSARVYDLDLSRVDSPLGTSGAVAISGARVVVGAPTYSRVAMAAGIVHVYDLGSAPPLKPAFTLEKQGAAARDNLFGSAVAISGTKVVVGESGTNNSGGRGSVYVYDLASATPAVPIIQLGNHSPPECIFGTSISMSGTRVVVGATGPFSKQSSPGSAYVYDLGSAHPSEPIVELKNPSPLAGDQFGGSTAISGNKVVVGAQGDDTGAEDSGTAYLYDLSSPTPAVPAATLKNPSPAIKDQFGRSVSIGSRHVFVGAPGDDAAAGNVYIFDLNSGKPAAPATLNKTGSNGQ